MIRNIALLVSVIALTSCAQTPVAHYGETMRAKDSRTVSIEKVVSDPKAYEGQTLLVEGEVVGVCQRKGCWLEMAAPDKFDGTLFVKFTCPVDGRLVPMEAVGKRAVVEGELVYEQLSEEDARHIAEEGGASAEEVAKIEGPQWQVSIRSPAADVYGLEPVSLKQ